MTNQTRIDKNKIIKEIDEKQDDVLSNIDSESIAVYIFIKNEFKKGNVLNNPIFQFVFRSYYRLDSAGLSDNQKTRFFQLLSDKQENLEYILSELYELLNSKNQNTIQFSFATKLLHTINNNKPIYDNNVSRVIKKELKGSGYAKDERICSCIETYQFLEELYRDMLEDETIRNIISKFRSKFKVDDEKISDIKVLDFIMWSLGDLKKEK